MKKIIEKIIYIISKIVPVNSKLIIFETGLNRANDNPRVVYDFLLKENDYNFELKYIVTKETDTTGIKKEHIVYTRTIKYIWTMMRAKFWIRSQSIGSVVKKKDNQVYIQLFHGDSLKREGYDRNSMAGMEKKRMPHTLEWDLLVVTNEFNENCHRTALAYDGEVVHIPQARYDVFFEDDYLNRRFDVLKKYNLTTNDQKIFLYAPTFRDWEENKEIIDSRPILEVYNSLPNKSIMLLRLHPQLQKQSMALELPDGIINVTSDPLINDILLITDCLISDYSSIFYDFLINKEDIGWYIYDEEKYYELRGENYIGYDELPGWVARTPQELQEQILKNYDNISKEIQVKNKKFKEKYFKGIDGTGAKKIVEYIHNRYETKK